MKSQASSFHPQFRAGRTSSCFFIRSWFLVLVVAVALVTQCGAASRDEFSQVETNVVSISYAELETYCKGRHQPTTDRHDPMLLAVAEAFGPDGLGLLEVTDIPDGLVELRCHVLELARQLATKVPANELDSLTLPETLYTIGWSHGKEQFDGKYDTRKGSFYVDPFRTKNVFPTSIALKQPLLKMTRFMANVGVMMARLIDDYLMTTMVHSSLESCVNSKARLLYYYPPSQDNEVIAGSDDWWCGWHKDHGSLTILLPGLLFASEEGDRHQKTLATDPKAGLYIQKRASGRQEPVHVSLAPTSLGVQLGETVEIMSGGLLMATPHAVRSSPKINGRASLALFLQPVPEQTLPDCPQTADASLQQRWRPTFGEFQKATTQAFN